MVGNICCQYSQYRGKLLIREPSYPDGAGGLVAALANALTSTLTSKFRSSREKMLFQLTQGLIDWYNAEPKTLRELQTQIARIEDADLRSLLLAVVASSWLESGDEQHALSLAQVTDSQNLAKAHFYQKLRTRAKYASLSFTSAQQQTLKVLVREVLLMIPLDEDEAFSDAIEAWFSVRLLEETRTKTDIQAQEPEQEYLGKMVNWTVSSGHLKHIS